MKIYEVTHWVNFNEYLMTHNIKYNELTIVNDVTIKLDSGTEITFKETIQKVIDTF